MIMGNLPSQPPKSDAEVAGKGDSFLYECPVCCGDFVTPKILPCGHLVCQSCLLTWMLARDTDPTCPLCRAVILTDNNHPDPQHVIDKLPTDWHTVALVKSHQFLREPRKCDGCESDEDASFCCVSCRMKLCVLCKEKHASLEELTGLSVARLAEHQPVTCQAHPNRSAEMFCRGHQVVVCEECCSTSHQDCADRRSVGRQAHTAYSLKEQLTQGCRDGADAQRAAKEELGHLVSNLRTGEAYLAKEIRKKRDCMAGMNVHIDAILDALQLTMDRRQVSLRQLQAALIFKGPLSEMEGLQSALMQHSKILGNMAQSGSGPALLRMMASLRERVSFLDKRVKRLQ